MTADKRLKNSVEKSQFRKFQVKAWDSELNPSKSGLFRWNLNRQETVIFLPISASSIYNSLTFSQVPQSSICAASQWRDLWPSSGNCLFVFSQPVKSAPTVRDLLPNLLNDNFVNLFRSVFHISMERIK